MTEPGTDDLTDGDTARAAEIVQNDLALKVATQDSSEDAATDEEARRPSDRA